MLSFNRSLFRNGDRITLRPAAGWRMKMNQIPEIERLQEAKRRALVIADERSKENVKLRAALQKIADLSDSEADERLDDAICIARNALQ